MKLIIISLLLFCQAMGIAQITFEEITAPVDFSINAVRKSPTGEYFVQASNDFKSIYSSLDGTHWTKDNFPRSYVLDEVQFFSDGTPFIKSSDPQEQLIRRNGSWMPMEQTASCIKKDTLFGYTSNVFSYSLDKGATFITLFEATEAIGDIAFQLCKFKNYLVLHYSSGSRDYLSVFTMNGERVLYTPLALNGGSSFLYNSCEQAYFFDHENFYLLKEDGLTLTHGDILDMFPYFVYADEMASVNGSYFIRTGNTIYKSQECESNWTIFAQDDRISKNDAFWIDDHEDLFLLDVSNNFFTEHDFGSSSWDEKNPGINYPYLIDANQGGSQNQLAVTPYSFFHKHTNDTQWTKTDSLKGGYAQFSYAPNGDLYMNDDTIILYSQDNGITFENITMPPFNPWESHRLYVLDNNVLFLVSIDFGGAYYSLNNGKDWIDVPISFFLEYPEIKLVDNYIYIAEADNQYTFYRVSILTNEVLSEQITDLFDYWGDRMGILDDGTFYFYAWDPANGNQEGIFRYRFETGLEFLPELVSLAEIGTLYTSGSDLFSFTRTSYAVYDGQTILSNTISGLPSTGSLRFWVTDDDYLIAFIGSNRFFRSAEPLSYPQYITGNISQDPDKDCIMDATDKGLGYWQLKIENEHYLRINNSYPDGDFKFSVPKGNYTLSCKPITSNWDLCEYSYPVTIDDHHLTVNQDFLGIGLAACAELAIDFSTPRLRRCFENTYTIRVRNFGPEATFGTTLTLKLDPYFEFISSTLPCTLVNDSTITVDLGTLELNETVTFKVVFKISCDAPLGTLHCLSGELSDDNLCGLSRSSYKECQENIGSVDPNDKRTFNEQGYETTAIEKDEYIYYHIRFQNTGTDTAFKVRVLDPLSPMLDLGTLEMLSASHPYEYEITDGPALSVTFDNILLPDSTINEAASNGFLKFRVKPLPQFDYGTEIPNQAGIFFDFNAPVLTNQTVLTIQHTVSTHDIEDNIEFTLFPNPTNSSLHLVLPDKDADRVNDFEIIDALGRRLISGKINGEEIDVTNLSPGLYTIVLLDNRKKMGRKEFVRI